MVGPGSDVASELQELQQDQSGVPQGHGDVCRDKLVLRPGREGRGLPRS